MVPLTGYLQLPAPASRSSGSQQLRLCGKGVCKSDTAVEEVELLADVGPWLKASTCATVLSSEQEKTASTRGALYAFPYSRHCICPCLCTCASLHPSALAIPDPSPSQRSQVSLSDNVTAVLPPKHQPFVMPPANFEDGNGR